MPSTLTMTGNPPFRCALSIQDNTGTGDKLLTLLRAAGFPGEPLMVRILGKKSDGTDRPAVVLATARPSAAIALTDFSTHGEYLAAGVESNALSQAFAEATFIRSAATAAVMNVVVDW
jgi:hypothetical protein